jgi:manganese/zinc/iron transport system permease protein
MEENEWITLDGQKWALTQKGFEEARTMFDKKEENNQ